MEGLRKAERAGIPTRVSISFCNSHHWLGLQQEGADGCYGVTHGLIGSLGFSFLVCCELVTAKSFLSSFSGSNPDALGTVVALDQHKFSVTA